MRQAVNCTMFLARVFHHSKLLFLVMVTFIIAQLFVVYNHGMVFSPFYNYWMYASKFTKSDSLPVTLIYSNGILLKGSDYSQQDWDKIHLTYNYIGAPDSNRRLYSEIKRLTRNAGHELGPKPFFMPEVLRGRDTLYALWKLHASLVSGKKIDSVVTVVYQWDGNKLIPR